MKTYKIEDAAAKTGLTKRTIRYYEELGLIETLDRTEGGMRLYSEEDIDRLNKIVLAKEVLGFSLQELQQFIKMNEAIDQHRHTVRSLEDRTERRLKLLEISEVLQREIEMIEIKMKRMDTFKEELLALSQRVREAIGKYEED
ncbi:MerR family transcriptional regulator [Paenibacillus sepulcri]|uniref:MerR family transcriptional regulator n=1 Tax=Paenibacillus sepulcri TaxID=359917 RepID=A0ABS7CA37_9BACL|nr:MerR family transcriptional regulator [Paenibacillus sepulcri]